MPVLLPKHCRGFCKLEDEVFPGLWWRHKVLSVKKKKYMHTHFANVSMRFFTPPRHCRERVCACVCTCVVGERKRRREVGTKLKIRFPVYCWQISAYPHIIHRNDPGEDQRVGWISVSTGCPHHVVHAGISTRSPCSPETSCPCHTTLHQFSNHISPQPAQRRA